MCSGGTDRVKVTSVRHYANPPESIAAVAPSEETGTFDLSRNRAMRLKWESLIRKMAALPWLARKS
jgi:hypothetical protein